MLFDIWDLVECVLLRPLCTLPLKSGNSSMAVVDQSVYRLVSVQAVTFYISGRLAVSASASVRAVRPHEIMYCTFF
jgi:hypothetical protein